MNETMLLPKEEGFVLEPVDDTGQNLIGFLLFALLYLVFSLLV